MDLYCQSGRICSSSFDAIGGDGVNGNDGAKTMIMMMMIAAVVGDYVLLKARVNVDD